MAVEALVGSAFGDTLVGDGLNNAIFGQGGSDSLWGFGGADSLFGGAGADDLFGGPGGDTLTGGIGNDRFLFYLADLGAGSHDVITDFHEIAGDFDLLVLQSGLPVSFADTAGGALVTFTVAGGTADILVQGLTAAQLSDQILTF